MEQKKNRVEGALLGYEIHPDGRREIRWRSGQEIAEPIVDQDLKPLHPKFRDRHRQALVFVYAKGKEIAASERKVALLFQEALEFGIEKRDLKDLEEFGLIEMPLVHLHRRNGSGLGGRKVVIPSPQGRALMSSVEKAMHDVQQRDTKDQAQA